MDLSSVSMVSTPRLVSQTPTTGVLTTPRTADALAQPAFFPQHAAQASTP
jgi:hypothetical protein